MIQTEAAVGKDDPTPLLIGTTIDLKREMPNGNRAWRDKGWRVIGYTHKANGKWLGYALEHDRIVNTTCSKFEAIDVVQLPAAVTP